MEANDIRAEMVRRKITVVSIAKKLGIAQPSISQVITRKKHTLYIRQAIAEAIDRPVEEVFPETKEAA
jgi:predicted transcriptional regulator